MLDPGLPPDPAGTTFCSSALRLLHAGQALQADDDGSLRFGPPRDAQRRAAAAPSTPRAATAGALSGGASELWLLAADGPPGSGRYTLRQAAAPHRFLAAVEGRLELSQAPQALQLFMDLNRRVVLRLPGKACLQAGAGGAALAGALPLGSNRASKLFTLEEAALPPHSLQAWPLRATLRADRPGGAGYLSASGRGLAAAAPVACCSEEWVLSLGEGAPLAASIAGGGALVAPGCRVWAADGRRLLSADAAGSGQVLLAQQHACSGGERFTVQLSSSGELALLAEQPEQHRQAPAPAPAPLGDGASGVPAGSAPPAAPALPVAVQHAGQLTCRSGSKPSKLELHLASGRPTLLLTAHGQLLGCTGRGSDRPCGLLPPAAARSDSSDSSSSSMACADAVRGCAWLLEHHGDALYSLRHAASGRALYIDDVSGTPRLDGPGAAASRVFPDNRLLFWMEPGWATLQGGSASGGSSGSGSSASGQPAASADSSSSSPAAQHGFVAPPPGGTLTAAGFSLRSLVLVGGRHLYLSMLPDGLATSVHATDAGGPSRWELFQPIDLQTLLSSPLRLLERLPCRRAVVPPQQLRRSVSMQALSSSSGSGSGSGQGGQGSASLAAGGRRSSHCSMQRPPSLPAVQEHSVHPAQQQQQQQQLPWQQQQEQQQAQPGPGRPPRRSQSDSALAELQRHPQARRHQEPRWLAQLLHQPRAPEGVGVCSAATLQDLACRQLCASLVAPPSGGSGGSGQRLTPALVAALQEELSAHLPDEVAAAIGRELGVLVGAPPPTKLPLRALAKAAASGDASVPAWAKPWVEEAQGGAAPAERQSTEGYLCACCAGASGRLLPLDPWVNPSHHLFLTAMERRARGGGPVRLRARRRLDREDPLIATLRAGKVALLAWAAARTLTALLKA